MVQSVSVLQAYGKVTAERRDTQWYSQSQYYRTTVRSLLKGFSQDYDKPESLTWKIGHT